MWPDHTCKDPIADLDMFHSWVDVLPEVNIHIEKILFLKGTIQSKFDSLLILGVIVVARE
jgi:hypothetical protein